MIMGRILHSRIQEFSSGGGGGGGVGGGGGGGGQAKLTEKKL